MLLATAGKTSLDCTITLSKDDIAPRLCVIDIEFH
jgi:hypothetical protein